jgi:hypothetical protein
MISRRACLPQRRSTEIRMIGPARTRRFVSWVWATGWLICLPTAGCLSFDLGQGQQGSSQTRQSSQPGAFVVEGTMVRGDFVRRCLVFEAANGVQYHLVQGNSVSEETFAKVTEVGAVSALEVLLRRDLDERCQADDVLEVLEVIGVLEIDSP